jgi:S-formylglutathione hydrolase FrmB
MRRLVTLGLSIALLVSGVFGAWAYAHDYYLYRGFAPPRNPPGVAAGTMQTVRFYSPALHGLRSYSIYLPPGFAANAARGVRYPVLYFLHGSPGWPELVLNAGGAGVTLDTLVARHAVKPFIIVMPDGRNGNFRSDTAWANTAHGQFESFVLDTVRAVDQRWPTKADRAHRAIAGLSDGAFGAVNIALHNLGTFGTAESWSGYFKQRATGPFTNASPAQVQANSPATYVRSMRTQLRRDPLHAFLYGGAQDRGSRGIHAFAVRLQTAGGRVSVAFPAGGHTWKLWRDEMPAALRYAGHSIGA